MLDLQLNEIETRISVLQEQRAEITERLATLEEALDRITYENAGAVLETARDMMMSDSPGLDV